MGSKDDNFNSGESVLRNEYAQIKKNPEPYFRVELLDDNIFEWRFVIFGLQDTPYEGGVYQGKLVFPQDYPFKTPKVFLITPNGRFKTHKNLCLSLHDRDWNPMWNISSILLVLLCSMNEDTKSFDFMIEEPDAKKRMFARESLEIALADQIFRTMFPDLAADIRKRVRERKGAKPGTNPASTGKSKDAKPGTNPTSTGKSKDAKPGTNPASTGKSKDAKPGTNPASTGKSKDAKPGTNPASTGKLKDAKPGSNPASTEKSYNCFTSLFLML